MERLTTLRRQLGMAGSAPERVMKSRRCCHSRDRPRRRRESAGRREGAARWSCPKPSLAIAAAAPADHPDRRRRGFWCAVHHGAADGVRAINSESPPRGQFGCGGVWRADSVGACAISSGRDHRFESCRVGHVLSRNNVQNQCNPTNPREPLHDLRLLRRSPIK